MLKTSLIEALAGGGPPASAVKDYLARGAEDIRRVHYARVGADGVGEGMGKDSPGYRACRIRTDIIDGLIEALYTHKIDKLAFKGNVTLAALGGYGRSELNVCSDIDLMLLYSGRLNPAIEELTQEILYMLWDTGLDLGFSIRSASECLVLASGDHKTMTSLLDMRYLVGDRDLYDKFTARYEKRLLGKRASSGFIEEKLYENTARREKYGESVYILEPNVKEGEGGLRDLHTAMWIVKARSRESDDPVALGLISEEEMTVLTASSDFILWVRNELHLETGRKADQLTFDHQERIARLSGFENTKHSLAVESFMQTYYRHAANIDHYSNLILSRCLHWEEKTPAFRWKKRVLVDGDFVISEGALGVRSPDVFKERPEAMLKAFEHSQANQVPLDQGTRDLILKNLFRVDERFRSSPEAAASFLTILRGKNVFRTLGEMHGLKFLGRYIPEFAGIACKVQHDRYHVYTVDAHTLFAIRELERLRDENRAEFNLLATLFVELTRPEILYLAVLFHDVGKALGKGHARTGAVMAAEACERLGLGADEVSMVRFLVANHLILADTAQYRDLHDEKLIMEFARKVGDMEKLNLLYLLTFADIRAVGPEVWSQWKGMLFQELYFKALTAIEMGALEAEETVKRREKVKEAAAKILAEEGFSMEEAEVYFKNLPRRYFLATGPETVAHHVEMLRELGTRPYIMNVRQDTVREYTEIIIATMDIHGLFSMIAGVMAANGVDILGTQIYTLTNGTVLDILQVKSSYGRYIKDESKLEKIERDLSDVLAGQVRVATIVGRRMKKSILDHRARPAVPTRVEIDNEVSDDYTVIDVRAGNRIGLLYDITSTLSCLGLYIGVAKITTKGDEAADVFYVKDIFGQKIFYKNKLAEIVNSVYDVIAGPARPGEKAASGEGG
ncbi:MAG: [protein-PII] uridylyltransferase [Thermodesulfobacteriota bacterium]